MTLAGYSTHVSVSAPTAMTGQVALVYARTFAPALMLLADGPESPGLLVRPRPGRLELGCDHVWGARLGAAVAFAAGSVRACLGAGALPRRRSSPT